MYVKVLCLLIVSLNVTQYAAEMSDRAYDRFAAIKCVFSSSEYSKLVFRRGSAPDPAGELTTLPQTP